MFVLIHIWFVNLQFIGFNDSIQTEWNNLALEGKIRQVQIKISESDAGGKNK